jgi:hypothetical protein
MQTTASRVISAEGGRSFGRVTQADKTVGVGRCAIHQISSNVREGLWLAECLAILSRSGAVGFRHGKNPMMVRGFRTGRSPNIKAHERTP